ncbi:thioredoxin-like protein [Aspergillus californicus]
MATWLARCGVKTRIVDKRGSKVFNGQADGLQCRTLEIFDSFGFGDRAWKEANHMLEICLWNPDSNGVLQRSARIADTIPGISRFQQVVLHQGRIERFFLDFIKGCSDNHVERGVLLTKLELDESPVDLPDAYPITVHLHHLSEADATPKQTGTVVNGSAIEDGLFRSNITADDTEKLIRASALDPKANTEEVVKVKYMLGADGAHSWVREKIGFTLEGESTDYIWGVLDIVPITNFQTFACVVLSILPAYNGGKRVDRSKINLEDILQAVQKIFAPYKISYRRLDWWTAYQIGKPTFSVEKGNMFASGIAVDYCSSVIVAKEAESNPVVSTQELVPEIKFGKRIPSVKVLSQADARPWHLQERLSSNGRWRLMVFAGDVTNPSQKQKIEQLGNALSSKTSFLQRYKPAGARYDAVIEVLTVHVAPRNQVDTFDFLEVFRPYDEIDGWDYEKIFVDDNSYHEGHGKLYESFGINPEKGCLVVLRPDQHVSYVGPLENYDAVDRFFFGFMLAQTVQ